MVIELLLGDGVEITGHLMVTGGRDCMVTVDSYHDLETYVFVCNLTKYQY